MAPAYRQGKLWAFAPVLVIAAYLVVQAAYLRAPFPSDPAIYFNAAARFPDVVPEHWQLRIGLLVPVRVAIEAFGFSQAAYYSVPVAAGVLLIGATYLLGRVMFGSLVGTIAASLLVFNRFFLTESSVIVPDVLAAGLFTIGIVLVIRVGIQARRAGSYTKGQTAQLVASGALFGWSYLTREFIALLFPLVALALVMHHVSWRRACALVALPAAALLVGELALNGFLYGDALVRFKVGAGHAQGALGPGVAETFQDQPVSATLLRLPNALRGWPEGLLILALFAASAVGAAAARSRALVVLVAWVLCLWVPLTLLGGIADQSSPLLRLQPVRYWFSIFPPMLVGGVGALCMAANRLPRTGWLDERRTSFAVSCTALAVGVGVAVTTPFGGADAFRATGGTQLEEFRSWLEGQGRVREVWTDARTATVLPIFTRTPFGSRVWIGDVRAFSPTSPPLPASKPAAMVLYGGDDRGFSPCGPCRVEAARTLGDPPQAPTGWRMVASSRDGLMRVYLHSTRSVPADDSSAP